MFNATDKAAEIQEERLKAQNALLGMFRPAGWPLGSVDNPLYVSQAIEKDRRFYGPLLGSHAFYQGGSMVDGDRLYGSYRS